MADSLYGNHLFLAIFLLVQQASALVRLRFKLTLYEQAPPAPKGKRGAPRKHGAKFKLSAPPRASDRRTMVRSGDQRVHLSAWQDLYLKKMPIRSGWS